ncbi:zinc finger and BTB domain-containing protein 4 [Corythoichthys intestinalis]|uniref:zinc finger and BTB domain-containing protein 4 n=1 Tax=Corythoichthys intestinalis TaxID=161448 RepID=UPI0025A55F61|nr:zinc finger and BTB domain-containing protein 4 [Corythoichthys intestinalis]XP_057712191.1 zinc finger and BTB domain-containing protein 4 [Corythoichthys intestinalis]XP_057712192.1 zinc finger and BTB domain-containing protein 4 [Corythoichthys intestinalis]XP_057712193.1 zinc finger and BTB domain-containing protein 4 [Corythoichthys intestinalis]
MVSGVKLRDPFHAGLIHPRLSERHPASGLAPPCTEDPASQRRTLASPPPVTLAASESLQAPKPEEEEGGGAVCQLEMKGKRHCGRGDGTMEESVVDGPKNAKITLSFPASAGPLPAPLTSSGYCRNAPSSSSPHRRRPSSKSSVEGSLWKLDSTMDVKHRPFKPPRHDASPSSSPSSSSSPMTVHTLIRKDIKSPPPLKCSKVSPEMPFLKSTPATYAGDGWDERHKMANGTASPSQTAQILFSLGSSAYQRGGGDAERKEKTTGCPGGKLGSPHGPSLQPPPLHLAPPLPPSEGLTPPPRATSYSPADGLKPELICGVCHRLFSSASSLTVHMRLHRGSRALSCRFCGKVFIHSKRLQSHEASCGAPVPPSRPGPSLAVRPKEEPLEEGELRPEEGEIDGSEKKPSNLLSRIQGDDDAAAAELLTSDESHFVKVVDGNVIYFCSVCERSYMTLSSLKRHSNVHSWRRRYPCHYCDKVFALAEYRTKHEVWHTGERRYQCIFCWDAFATYYNLKTHQKTIHGINPSLISSEKTANGGYKQKANALKLYRLLPMRSQKRPYKTYSDNLHNGLLMSPTEASSLSLPGLDCALTGDLQSFISGANPQSVKPDPDGFSDNVPPAERDGSVSLRFPQTDSLHPKEHDDETHKSEPVRGGSKISSSGKTKIPKALRCNESASTPSVITYGHAKQSVIVHGTAVSSSVIVHSNQVSPQSELNKLSEMTHKGSAKSLKRQREGADGHRKRPRESLDPKKPETETDGSCFKSRKSHVKNDLAKSKQPSPLTGSPIKETGPLCQITVRIGEEAIVKRSISETDLRRDKSRSPPKGKKGETSSVKGAHHHKHHVQRRASQEDTAGDSKEEVAENTGNSSDELREYNFRQKVREQESDHDVEDNLWRPYYSYKPKKKAQAQVQRFKSWQRKLKFKRALRLKRRAEKLKKRGNKEKREEDGKPSETENEEKQAKDVCHELSTHSPPSPKPPVAPSVTSTGLKRRAWTNGDAAECSTCGCWFSSSNKRDQHELSHLLEFVCLFCRATFPSRDKLEDHQKMEHPKPADTSAAPPKAAFAEDPDPLKPEGSDKKEDQVKSSLSRRALSRHTCPQCHKVCKTSSALNRHLRRHEFSSSSERAEDDDLPKPETTARCNDPVPEKGQVVSVISYLTADPPKSVDYSSTPDEPTSKTREAKSGDEPRTPECPHPPPERKPSPKINQSPINLAPAKAQLALAPPRTLQSVLVMSKPECLDYRTAGKRNFETMASSLHSLAAPSTSANVPVTPQARITTAAPPVSMATVNSSERGVVTRDGVIMDRERQARSAMFAHTSYKEQNLAQDLRVKSVSRSPSPIEAQDLTMSSILAREREMERQRVQKREVEKQRERGRDKDRGKEMEKVQHSGRHEHTPVDQTSLLVPKEEPVSPVPSPQQIPAQTTTNGHSSHRHTPKSPCRPTHLAAASQQVQELERLTLPGDRPSAHALLLPRATKALESELRDTSRDVQHVEPAPVCYPVQDYPLPLVGPDTYQPAKKQDDNLLMSAYPAGALPFGPLGKMMIPNSADLTKLPFYPDPYQLLYGSQLLAYPYNVAALPMALNMMAPGTDKVEPLPFLPAIFNYGAGAGPYVGATPHPLVANPSFYGSGKKQRDGSSNKQ